MKVSTNKQQLFIIAGALIGTVAGATSLLVHYVRQEIERRGYPSWHECRCEFKTQETIFQVWHSHHEQRGETIIAQEWGTYLVKPPLWLRSFLHYATQTLAVLNPFGRYIERVTLSPQQSYQFAAILHASTTNEDLPEPTYQDDLYVIWRREVLHFPRYLFDAYLRRLYPVNVPEDRLTQEEGLPALWDPASNLPLPNEGSLLETPVGTRIDCIGWAPAQISYCTARSLHS
ncbi:hypothetical protein KDAU_12800 [Dictyobacter aurantiacus]|uniref:Uncharacterized protein n=1 Tax=Dictyobacter aurantiacus TaxID=1936993 RepID=A0A401ZAP0_9CHLR|nr:hypothetical protein KDAU_12800 [Dictyobacter aurantiacus]